MAYQENNPKRTENGIEIKESIPGIDGEEQGALMRALWDWGKLSRQLPENKDIVEPSEQTRKNQTPQPEKVDVPIDISAHRMTRLFPALHDAEQTLYLFEAPERYGEKTEVLDNGIDLLDTDQSLGSVKDRVLTMARTGKKKFLGVKGLGGNGKSTWVEQFVTRLSRKTHPDEKRIKAFIISLDQEISNFYPSLSPEFNHHTKWRKAEWLQFSEYFKNKLIHPDPVQLSFEDFQSYDDYMYVVDMTMGLEGEKDKADSSVKVANEYFQQHPEINNLVEWILVTPDKRIGKRAGKTRSVLSKLSGGEKELKSTLKKLKIKLMGIGTHLIQKYQNPNLEITYEMIIKRLNEKVSEGAPAQVMDDNISHVLNRVKELRNQGEKLISDEQIPKKAFEGYTSKTQEEDRRRSIQYIFHRMKLFGLSAENTIVLAHQFTDDYITWYAPPWPIEGKSIETTQEKRYTEQNASSHEPITLYEKNEPHVQLELPIL